MFNKIIDFMADIFNSLHSIIVNMGVSNIGVSYVLSILVFTLIIRIIILPFNIKAANSTRGMQKIQPELKKIQAKYKDTPEKLNAEMMKLYKENNVSPVGGCLPSLLPLPILMALYYVFFRIDGLNGQSFLWINDLGAPDQNYILPVLAALSTFIPSYLMTKSAPKQENGMNMATMNIVMAGMMGFMSLRFKSILVLYWIIGNLIQLVQTYFLNYRPMMKESVLSEKDKESNNSFISVNEPKNLASTKKKKK